MHAETTEFPPPDAGEETADEPDPAFGETDDEDAETPDDDEPGPDDSADPLTPLSATDIAADPTRSQPPPGDPHV